MVPVKPVADGKISSPYGVRRTLFGETRIHLGLDIVSPTPDAPIYAAFSGTVIKAGWNDNFGNRIWLKRDDGLFDVYAHLKIISSGVHEGAYIKQGQQIGIMGNTGRSTGVHLHYETRTAPNLTGKSINPIEVAKLYSV